MRTIRAVMMVSGVGLAAFGVAMLVGNGWSENVAIVWWLGGGVVLHDAILAPATIILGLVVMPLLPQWARVPVTVGTVVLGSVTLLAVPVLGRFGSRPGAPTLLDRNYVGGWFVFAGIVVVAVVFAAVRRRVSLGTSSVPRINHNASADGASADVHATP